MKNNKNKKKIINQNLFISSKAIQATAAAETTITIMWGSFSLILKSIASSGGEGEKKHEIVFFFLTSFDLKILINSLLKFEIWLNIAKPRRHLDLF